MLIPFLSVDNCNTYSENNKLPRVLVDTEEDLSLSRLSFCCPLRRFSGDCIAALSVTGDVRHLILE